MTEWMQLAVNFGLPTIILFMLGSAIWVSMKFVANKFFDDTHGIIPKIVTDNRAFLDGLAERHNKQLQLCERHSLAIVALHDAFPNPEHFATDKTNAALVAVIDAEIVKIRALESIQNDEKNRIEELLIEARSRLTEQV